MLISFPRILIFFHIEKSKSKPQLRTFRIFLDPILEHPLNLLQKLLTAMLFLFLAGRKARFIVFHWAILFEAEFDVFFDVA